MVYQANYSGVANLTLVTTNHGHQLRGSPSIDDSLPNGVSAQAPIKTLSGWSGAIRGEIAVKLTLAVYRLGQGSALRFSVHFRKAQSDAHSELTPNRAAQAAANLLLTSFKLSQPKLPRVILSQGVKFVGTMLQDQNGGIQNVTP
ncbi:hypothetical protein ACFQHW_04030 [Lapidilactobacillus achengensis]|uniref:Uncharacterized protein n=1 Tax=Lapidilactobacillus achengensis TaxID=2486000 RepID=A0ABW1ULB1_9LACO|nr:hypothetical protein [Lapidilactobacillus achengensis]